MTTGEFDGINDRDLTLKIDKFLDDQFVDKAFRIIDERWYRAIHDFIDYLAQQSVPLAVSRVENPGVINGLIASPLHIALMDVAGKDGV